MLAHPFTEFLMCVSNIFLLASFFFTLYSIHNVRITTRYFLVYFPCEVCCFYLISFSDITTHNTVPTFFHVTHDMCHKVGGEHSLKISAPQLLRFGIDSVLKIMTHKLINDKGVCKNSPGYTGSVT